MDAALHAIDAAYIINWLEMNADDSLMDKAFILAKCLHLRNERGRLFENTNEVRILLKNTLTSRAVQDSRVLYRFLPLFLDVSRPRVFRKTHSHSYCPETEIPQRRSLNLNRNRTLPALYIFSHAISRQKLV